MAHKNYRRKNPRYQFKKWYSLPPGASHYYQSLAWRKVVGTPKSVSTTGVPTTFQPSTPTTSGGSTGDQPGS